MNTLSFVIPVYNEEKRIEKTFKALKTLSLPRGLSLDEIIFVNDGSKDRTEQLITDFTKHQEKLPTQLISYSTNKGKGYAIRQGMLASKADYTVFFDADMSTPLTELEKIMPDIKKGTDVIIGTRKNGQSTVIKHQPMLRELLGRGFTLITQTILQLKVTDFTCGFKGFSKSAKDQIFPQSKINRWSYDAELLFLANQLKLSMHEVPVAWENDERTRVKLYKDIPISLYELISIVVLHGFILRLINPLLPIPQKSSVS